MTHVLFTFLIDLFPFNIKNRDIFGMNYYPPELVDWWMDDWISFVYGKKRTFKAYRVNVFHHTGAHGQRYDVDQSNELKLGNMIYIYIFFNIVKIIIYLNSIFIFEILTQFLSYYLQLN
jgi:hypothetical protein